ncbi:MAG: chromosomal replication initiator protein DnaA [Thermodesulfobacteriota bacterium]|nr:chromosomal replication initiator protein DnaA [Thermodesulfobacteriota bacterium]
MLWEQTKDRLKNMLPESTYSLWIKPLSCIRADDQIVELVGPDQFFCSWVSEKYSVPIRESLSKFCNGNPEIRFTVGGKIQFRPEEKPEQLALPAMPFGRARIPMLHPRYTFEEFMVGESNILAHSACHALAKGDTSFGPCIYIKAGTGLGKSHLTQAVAHHVIDHAPSTRICCLTAKQLTAEMVRSIKNNTMDHFKTKYHNQCDMLLVEDVHILAGKPKTQEELAAAVDALLDAGKTMIFTGKMIPRKIPDIDMGFRSRISAGLITTINPPDVLTRSLIIKRKAENSNLPLSKELMLYMAGNLKGDIRQVESAIAGLSAKSSLLKMVPDLGMVKEVIADIIGRSRLLTLEIIRDFVADQFKVTVSDLQSKSRKKAVSFPRQVSMYLARKYTKEGLDNIGKAFNRDHSTVVHSVRKITEQMVRNSTIRGQVEFLNNKLKKQYM